MERCRDRWEIEQDVYYLANVARHYIEDNGFNVSRMYGGVAGHLQLFYTGALFRVMVVFEIDKHYIQYETAQDKHFAEMIQQRLQDALPLEKFELMSNDLGEIRAQELKEQEEAKYHE